MYSTTRRGRGGVAGSDPGSGSGKLRPTLAGSDTGVYSISDRVSKLGLTTATITPQTEQHISWLLDEILIHDRFHENPFELAAYACALEREKNTQLLTLVLDLAFQKVKDNRHAITNFPRLFEVMAGEILPSMEDGSTINPDGQPLKGTDLFLKYLSDQLRRSLAEVWEEKEVAVGLVTSSLDDPEAEATASRAVEQWATLIYLTNSLRWLYLISELQFHELIIEKQLSALKPTAREVGILSWLIMPYGIDKTMPYKMRAQLEKHRSKLRALAKREDLSSGSHTLLIDMARTLDGVDAKAETSAKPLQSTDRDLVEKHPLVTGANKLPASLGYVRSATSTTRSHSHTSGTMIAQAEPSLSPIPPQRDSFQITSATAAETPVQDYTTEIREAECSESAIHSSALSDIWLATLRRGTRVAIKCGYQGENAAQLLVMRTISKHDPLDQHTVKELNVWSKLNHVNILPLLGIALFKGQLAMVSGWMDQGSIIKVVNSRPELDRFSLCARVVEVVVWLHSKELVHGDLKGANILMTEDNVPKLTDFGLSIMHQEVLRFSRETTYPGGGTTRWMAPELFEDDPTRSYKTDIYALGMTMLEILTGEVPFQEITNELQISSVVTRDKITPKRPECLVAKNPQHEAYWNAMRRCWVYNPKQRATAEEIERIVKLVPEESGLAKSLKTRINCCTMA
ncbi:hypothetical protein FRC07_004156 [Ceratobasidium sp. 392]|nr:hypothetical protein FRC07_004156 [Ceratobasidium sp. 392]